MVLPSGKVPLLNPRLGRGSDVLSGFCADIPRSGVLRLGQWTVLWLWQDWQWVGDVRSWYCSPVSPSHRDHLFHSCGIFSLGWQCHLCQRLLVYCESFVPNNVEITVTCPLGTAQLPFGCWGEGGWKELQPSWHQPLLGTWWKLSWSRSYHESLICKSHLGLSYWWLWNKSVRCCAQKHHIHICLIIGLAT